MHKIKSTFLAIMLSLIAFQTQALTIGEAGPAFDLPGDGASTVKLSSYKGNFLNTNPAKFTIAYDAKGVTPKAYGIKGMPSSVLLDADGKVLFQHTGFRESDRAQLEKTIQQALGQSK